MQHYMKKAEKPHDKNQVNPYIIIEYNSVNDKNVK